MLILIVLLIFSVLFLFILMFYRVHTLLDESRKLHEEFKEERDLAQAIVASMGEGVMVLDLDYRIKLINPAAEKFLETTAKEAIGQKWNEFGKAYVGDREIRFEERSAVKSLKTGQVKITSITDDHYYVTRSGRKFPVVAITGPFIHNNKIIGIVKVFRDASKEKDIDRMKTEFISLASHQLRTPLSAVKWFTELLVDPVSGPLTEEQRQFVKNISDSTMRMIELVNSLLNISRIESGRIIIEPKPTDLLDLVKKIIVDLQKKINEKKLKFIVSTHEQLPLINIDSKMICHVYVNLIENAIKYTPDGGEISVFISRKDNQIIFSS